MAGGDFQFAMAVLESGAGIIFRDVGARTVFEYWPEAKSQVERFGFGKICDFDVDANACDHVLDDSMVYGYSVNFVIYIYMYNEYKSQAPNPKSQKGKTEDIFYSVVSWQGEVPEIFRYG